MNYKAVCRTAPATPGLLKSAIQSHILFFQKSGSSTLTVASALLCFITPPFSYTKIPYRSHLYVDAIQIQTFSLKSLERWTKGNNHLFQNLWLMKPLSIWPNLAWTLALKWNMNWLCKEKKGTSCDIKSKKRQNGLKKIKFLYFKVQWSKQT